MRFAIGPVLLQHGGYAFDSWRPDGGFSRSYVYARIEDAHYARRRTIDEASGDARLSPVACRTSEEFAQAIASATLATAA